MKEDDMVIKRLNISKSMYKIKTLARESFFQFFLPVIESNENWQQKYGVHQLQMFDD